MPLDELPDAERTCENCANAGADGPCCLMCPRNDYAEPQGAHHDYWKETGESVRASAEKRIEELELALRKIHDRAHEWNAIPLCVEIERMAFDALGLERGK